MILQYASDLHLEFKKNKDYLDSNPLRPVADVLILAGDIIPLAKISDHNYFLDYLSDHWDTVLWIPGNHEFYGSNISDYNHSFQKRIRPNVILCHRTVYEIDHIPILCATLWSHIPINMEYQITQQIADFRNILHEKKPFTIQDFNSLHSADLEFLTTSLNMFSSQNINPLVVTHHIPTLQFYPVDFLNSPLNCAFVSEQFELIYKHCASHWIYGHHHQNIDYFKIGDTYLVTNQLGHVGRNEHKLFQHSRTIQL